MRSEQPNVLVAYPESRAHLAFVANWSGEIWRFAKSKPLGMLGVAILLIFAGAAILAPLIAPFGVQETHAAARLVAPNSTYLMGTDRLGRDVFSRVLFGARTSLFVGGMATFLGIAAGALVGLISGFRAGHGIDHLLQRLIDLQMSMPAILLAIVVITGAGRGVWTLILVVALVFIPTTSRVVRGTVLSESSRPYVEAAHTIGCREARIMFRHILPNIMGPLIVLATAALGNALLVEGSLSFLGYGPPPPTPTLGGMLASDGRTVFRSAIWLAIFPGLVLALAVYSFNVLGDALRDRLDPRMRGTR